MSTERGEALLWAVLIVLMVSLLGVTAVSSTLEGVFRATSAQASLQVTAAGRSGIDAAVLNLEDEESSGSALTCPSGTVQVDSAGHGAADASSAESYTVTYYATGTTAAAALAALATSSSRYSCSASPAITPLSSSPWYLALESQGATAAGQVHLVPGPETVVVEFTTSRLECVFCLMATSGQTLSMSGGASLMVSGGTIFDNSDWAGSPGYAMEATGGSTVTDCGNASLVTCTTSGAAINVVGAAPSSQSAAFSPSVNSGAAAVTQNPLTEPPVPVISATAQNVTCGTACTLTPGTYGQVTAHAPVTLSPGVYVIEGTFGVPAGGSLSGSGVTLYFTCTSSPGNCAPGSGAGNNCSSNSAVGCLYISGSGAVSLSAPTTGPYAGLVMYGDPNDQAELNFSGSGALGVVGTIYAPGSYLHVSGGSNVTTSLQSIIDVASANVSGQGIIEMSYTAGDYGATTGSHRVDVNQVR